MKAVEMIPASCRGTMYSGGAILRMTVVISNQSPSTFVSTSRDLVHQRVSQPHYFIFAHWSYHYNGDHVFAVCFPPIFDPFAACPTSKLRFREQSRSLRFLAAHKCQCWDRLCLVPHKQTRHMRVDKFSHACCSWVKWSNVQRLDSCQMCVGEALQSGYMTP